MVYFNQNYVENTFPKIMIFHSFMNVFGLEPIPVRIKIAPDLFFPNYYMLFFLRFVITLSLKLLQCLYSFYGNAFFIVNLPPPNFGKQCFLL